MKSVRSLLRDLTTKHPSLISDLIMALKKDFSLVGKVRIYVVFFLLYRNFILITDQSIFSVKKLCYDYYQKSICSFKNLLWYQNIFHQLATTPMFIYPICCTLFKLRVRLNSIWLVLLYYARLLDQRYKFFGFLTLNFTFGIIFSWAIPFFFFFF